MENRPAGRPFARRLLENGWLARRRVFQHAMSHLLHAAARAFTTLLGVVTPPICTETRGVGVGPRARWSWRARWVGVTAAQRGAAYPTRPVTQSLAGDGVRPGSRGVLLGWPDRARRTAPEEGGRTPPARGGWVVGRRGPRDRVQACRRAAVAVPVLTGGPGETDGATCISACAFLYATG